MKVRVSMMKIKQAVFLIIMLLMLVSCSGEKAGDNAQNGLYKISDFSGTDVDKLDGIWEFYWDELLTPDDFAMKNGSTKWMAEVPGPWSNYKKDGEKLPKQGYATFRLHIEFPEGEVGTTQSLYIPGVSSAYKLYVGGELEAENGVVGESRNSMVAKKGARMVQFPIHDKQVELVIQVSNFNQRKAGIFDSIFIGEPESIVQYREKKLVFRLIIVVSLIVMGLYHIALFALRRNEFPLIFFGVLCLLLSVRAALLDGILISYTLPFISWEWGNKLEYLGASLGCLFFTLYTYTQFPQDMGSKIRNGIVSVMAAYSLFVVATPSIIFTNTMQLLQLIIILVFIYLIYVDTKALIRKRESSLLNAVANLIIFMAIINDVLFYNHYIQTTELASVGLFFFLFTQSIIISRHYSRSFKQTEKLSSDLTRLNASLEQQVYERTIELRQMNQELQTANQKLNEAHQSRSKWIRNIYHEIATPLTTIRAYMKGILDGVIKGDREYIKLVHEQSMYLSRLLNDLHDMTEIENREITFNRKKVNVREYAQKLYDKYKVDIEKQGISFLLENSTSAEEDNLVLIDKHRIEQVIVNFLTNAQKFIGKMGFIKMELDKDGDHQVVLRIRDNGAGINEREIDFVFDRFFKSRSQESLVNGSGLGLAISKEIIEFHGGVIGVTSTEGEGSCFYFTLPIVSTVTKTAR